MVEISVIVPVYNVSDYLEECLNSILRQKDLNFEVICVEDFSSDNSMQILEKYSVQYSNFYVIKNSRNRGLSYSRNAGLLQATGTYVYFVDSDDKIKDNCLSELYKLAEREKLEGVFFDTDILYEEGFIIDTYKAKRTGHYSGVLNGREIFVQLHKNGDYDPCVWKQFWKREYLISKQIKFIEGIYYEDNPFTFNAILKLERGMCINKSYYIYRRRTNSITGTINEKKLADRLIGISDMQKTWLNSKFDMETEKVISQYLVRMLLWTEKLIYNNNLSADKILTYIEGTHAGLLLKRHQDEIQIVISEENEKKIKNSDSIIIYGAGKAARRLLEYLDCWNISIEGIAVSDISKSQKYLFCHKVKPIEDYIANKENLLVIIAVKNQRIQNDIRNILNNNGFSNIIAIS